MNNRSREASEGEALVRNRLAQKKHREKRKMAEKENAALKKRVKELEAQIMEMRRRNGKGTGENGCRCQRSRNSPNSIEGESGAMPSPVDHFQQQFSQSQPTITYAHYGHHAPSSIPHQFPHSPNSANFLFPQTRISRSLSVSNSSLSSRCSSAVSFASNYEAHSPSNYQGEEEEDYVPNCQTLANGQHGNLAILDEFLDFGGNANGPSQSKEGNGFYEPMQNLVLSSNSPLNGRQGAGILPSPIESFDSAEECDLITPMARGFVHSSDFSFDDLDLITPRP